LYYKQTNTNDNLKQTQMENSEIYAALALIAVILITTLVVKFRGAKGSINAINR
jgi:hypothetical protein